MLLFKSLRIEQWAKNLVIFFPILFAGQFDFEKAFILLIAFVSFSFIVSSTYIINDIIDIESDKTHPTKKLRPIASGKIEKKTWLMLSLSFFLTGSYALTQLNQTAYLLSLIYVVLTITYSFYLKYIKYLDLVTITLLFLLRMYVGSVIFNTPVSNELLFFVLFMSLGLTGSKKYSILVAKDIRSSKVKNFLELNYSNVFLESISKYSLIFGNLTYLYWVLFTKSNEVASDNILFLFFAFVFLSIFNYLYLKELKNGNTEDIFTTVKKSKYLLFSILLFLLFSVIGVI